MDVFPVDSWASSSATDDLNARLFGAVKDDYNKSPKKKMVGTKAKNQAKPDKFRSKKEKRRKEQSNAHNVAAHLDAALSMKKTKKAFKQCQTSDGDPGFKSNETTETPSKIGVSVLKRKQKKSSKRNKYKHLDEMRLAQKENASVGVTKLDMDISAKLLAKPESGNKAAGRSAKSTSTESEFTRNNSPVELSNKNKTKVNKLKSRSEPTPPKIQTAGKSTQKRKNTSAASDVNEPDAKGPKAKKQKVQPKEEHEPVLKQGKQKQRLSQGSSFNTHGLKAALEKSNKSKTWVIESNKNKPPTLREKMLEKLNSARFRFLNEKLYTVPGDEALRMMQQDDSAFIVYHQGFQQQVSKWPQNPVNRMIAYIKKRPGHVVADFGCGEAKIAQSVSNKVHSFDLVALNKFVTPCDMADVPLKDESVDIVVFCLSLMGTNLGDFLAEAHRVLRMGGNLLIAEVVSRFTSVKRFQRKLERMGFTLLAQDAQSKMFLWFELKKTGDLKEKLPEFDLSPCFYKKR